MAETLSSSSKSEISIEEVTNIDTFDDAIKLSMKLDVDFSGLNTLEEMVERLAMEVEKSQPEFVNMKKQVCCRMKNLKRDDDKKRKKLHELLTKTESKFPNDDVLYTQQNLAIIEQSLKTEGIITDIHKEIAAKKQSMKKGECCFVVAGETSAGKSLFLNLLLGEDVLPSCHPPCTSVITRLSYGKTHHARIVYHNHDRADDVFEDFKYEDLSHVLNEGNYKKREVTSEIKEVRLYLPSKFLETGIVLVDTPGIGENEDMDTVIEKFVDDNEVNGFIYIIKSNAGGGVDEDRLIKLMRIILQKEKTKSEKNALRFNPECAIFVCNWWDEVTEPAIVYKHIVRRLEKIWPKFDERKVIRFSAGCAKRETDLDVDYINKDYKQVLGVLETVYDEALNGRIKTTYKWIQTILLRSVHHLKIIVRQLNSSDDRLQIDMKDATEKLNRLESKSANTIKDFKTRIDTTSQNICDDFRTYLKSPLVKMAIRQWINAELPDAEVEDKDGNMIRKEWQQLKIEIDETIINRISVELDRWEEENEVIQKHENSIVSDIQKELFELANDVHKIEKLLCESSLKRTSVTTIHIEGMKLENDNYSLSTAARNKIWGPFSKIVKRVIPVSNRTKEYLKDKKGYATKRSEKLLKRFTDPSEGKDTLKPVIDCFMEGAYTILKDMEDRIPTTIMATQNILDHVRKCKRESFCSRRQFEKLMSDFELLKLLLAEYGAGYIFVDDFKPNELQVLDPNDATGRTSAPFKISDFFTDISMSQGNMQHHQCPRALWTAHQKGLLKKVDSERPVSIKVYLPSCKMDKCFSEIAKWRLLEHKHVATFLGIQHSQTSLPAMVFKDHLHTLKNHISKHNRDMNIFGCLQEVLEGLEYLHKNGMVHMELSTNTIMVNTHGSVRLTGSCIPRHADLPEDLDQHICADFVYLAPEVLNGDLYIACADIYAFGLVILELITGTLAFRDQRKMSLDIFIRNIIQKQMMNLSEIFDPLPDMESNLIRKCVEQSVESRPSLEDIKKALPKLKLEALNESEQCDERTFRARECFQEITRL